MVVFEVLMSGLANFFTFSNILAALVGTTLGIIFGALPGFTASMGVAILLPLTYGLPPEVGLTLLACIYMGAMYGGSIPAILMHTPGTPGAAATVIDGYPMAQKGQPATAIVTSATASAVGGVLATLVLFVTGPVLSYYAARISPAEIFLVTLLGLIVLGNFAGKNVIKGFLGGIIGLLLGTIGADFVLGYNRFTFGLYQLYEGLPLVPSLVGLLAISECFYMVQHIGKDHLSAESVKFNFKDILKDIWEVIGKRTMGLLRAVLIGVGIGFVPGEGAAVANFVAYDQAKRASKHPELFGTGIREGIIAPEASNNAVVPMALLPAFALGIPGSSTAALILSGVMMQGLRPGPGVFERSPDIMGVFMVGLLFASIILLVIGILIVKPASQVARIDNSILAGIILILAFVGVYAIQNSVFDIGLMLVLGIVGYTLKNLGTPPVTIVVGMVLGPIAEKNLTTALSISNGDLSIFFLRPVAIILWIIIFLSIYLPWRRKRREQLAHGLSGK